MGVFLWPRPLPLTQNRVGLTPYKVLKHASDCHTIMRLQKQRIFLVFNAEISGDLMDYTWYEPFVLLHRYTDRRNVSKSAVDALLESVNVSHFSWDEEADHDRVSCSTVICCICWCFGSAFQSYMDKRASGSCFSKRHMIGEGTQQHIRQEVRMWRTSCPRLTVDSSFQERGCCAAILVVSFFFFSKTVKMF